MGVDLSEGHEAMDYEEHAKTYALFVKGTVYISVLIVLTLVLMAIFLL